MVTEAQYAELRKLDGCENLIDLPATIKDSAAILKIADMIGVEDEYRFVNNSPTIEGMKETYNQILRLTRKFSCDRIPHLLIVYIGGHGATKDESQVFLLNSSEPKKAIDLTENKLRHLIKDSDSFTRIVAVFDCCRANLANYKGLIIGRG